MPYQDSYMYKVRQLVGDEFKLIMPTVDVVIKRNDAFLLVYNKDFDAWAFPGGYVEEASSWADNAGREAEEEAGIKAGEEQLKLIGTVSGPDYLAKYPNGNQVQLFTNVFLVETWDDESNQIDETEITEKKWFSLDELKNTPLTFSGKQVFEVYQQFQTTGSPINLTAK